ncbi:MAG: cytochrome d ubiquinol oxidase subunit II [Bacteroidota bacterium]|nr:cytochrome d ubiquinol oxidase subunit II [Bacteroidota bacterium]
MEENKMLLDISYLLLQQYWWIIISILAGALVFLLFVQGGQTLIYNLGKTEIEQTMIVNALGRKWEFTFSTLVTFGGAFFASFPLFYATSFGGAYWVWMAILFCFIVQAVSYEFRSKPNNFLGKRTYDAFLFFNGALGPFLLGVVVATLFTGSQFSVNDMNLSQWETPYYGLEALLNIQNLTLGFAILFLSRTLGILFLINSLEGDNLIKRARKRLWYEAGLFLVFFLLFLIRLLFAEGYAYDRETGLVFMEANKYLNNILQMPLNTLILLIGVILVLWALFISLFKNSTRGFWFAGSGTFLTVFSLLILAGFNQTAFYPSSFDLQSSLTIENSSSSYYTLKVMSVVSLMIPFVIAYIWYTWKLISNKKISEEEIKSESHIY